MRTDQLLNTDQAHVYGALTHEDTQVRDFEFEDLVAVLDALPSHTIFVLEMMSDSGDHFWRLMARDIPRPGRRYTNLDTGTEWIGLAEIVKADGDYGVGVWTVSGGARGHRIAMAAVE